MVIVTSKLEALVSANANLVPLSNAQMAADVEATPLFVVCQMRAIDIPPEVT